MTSRVRYSNISMASLPGKITPAGSAGRSEDQDFQDEVLTAYHLFTIIFEQSPAVKVVRNHNGRGWVKNFQIKQ